jgi:hypothetical protein
MHLTTYDPLGFRVKGSSQQFFSLGTIIRGFLGLRVLPTISFFGYNNNGLFRV